MAVIEATDVTRTYGRGSGAFTAVAGVGLAVERGELVAVLGAPELRRNQVHLSSSDLHATLSALMRLADSRATRLADISARSASLEQAFLALASDDAGHGAPPAA